MSRTETPPMLVFERPSADTLEIHLDLSGLEELQRHLDQLRRGEEHVHLKTPDWGGSELSGEAQGEDHEVVHHVKMFLWRDES